MDADIYLAVVPGSVSIMIKDPISLAINADILPVSIPVSHERDVTRKPAKRTVAAIGIASVPTSIPAVVKIPKPESCFFSEYPNNRRRGGSYAKSHLHGNIFLFICFVLKEDRSVIGPRVERSSEVVNGDRNPNGFTRFQFPPR